jgi:hypothetical protein
MERDTSTIPRQRGQQPVDTFLQQQGTNPNGDTAGYSGMEHPDTSGAVGSGSADTARSSRGAQRNPQ